MGTYRSREKQGLDVGLRGNSRRALALSTSQSATSQCDWGFHTVWSGIGPGDLRFRPRFVGVVEI